MVCSKDCQSCSHTSSCCKGRQLTGAKVNGVTTVGCVHNSSGVTRFKPSSVQDALALLNKYKEFGAGIVAGDTGKGETTSSVLCACACVRICCILVNELHFVCKL